MALQFSAANFPGAKTKREQQQENIQQLRAGLSDLGQGIDSYTAWKMNRQKLTSDADRQKRDDAFALVKNQIDLLNLSRGQAVVDPKTGETKEFPGVTGYFIDFDENGHPKLFKEDGADPGVRSVKTPINPMLPATQTAELSDTSAAREQLRQLISGAVETGFGTGNPYLERARASDLNPLRPLDPKASAFRQLVASTKQVIGKGLEGGVLRKEDEIKYDAIIPRAGDTQEILFKKAQQLDEMLALKERSRSEGFQSAGFRGVPAINNPSPIQAPASRVRVSNGSETLEIDPADLGEAQADGFQVVQ